MLSIITPVLNGARFIRENIISISHLTISHEHIIVDGGSTDETLDILKEYPDLIVLHQTDKKGMYKAIDMGFQVAKGEYICWVNCDDRVIPDAYDKLYQYANANQYDFVSSDGIHDFINENRKIIVRSTRFVKYFTSKALFPFSQPSVLYTKNAYNQVGGLRYELFKICGDGDLFTRMAQDRSLKFSYLPLITSCFIKYGQSLGDKNDKLYRVERKQIYHKRFLIDRMLLKVLRLLKI